MLSSLSVVDGQQCVHDQYLCISEYTVREGLCRNRKVGMYSLPVSVKCVIVDCSLFVEKHRNSEARLKIRHLIVAELRMRELVLNLCVWHFRRVSTKCEQKGAKAVCKHSQHLLISVAVQQHIKCSPHKKTAAKLEL